MCSRLHPIPTMHLLQLSSPPNLCRAADRLLLAVGLGADTKRGLRAAGSDDSNNEEQEVRAGRMGWFTSRRQRPISRCSEGPPAPNVVRRGAGQSPRDIQVRVSTLSDQRGDGTHTHTHKDQVLIPSHQLPQIK